MNLIHFTNKPFTYDPNFKYDHPRYTQRPYHKPVGIWVSDEDEFGWKEWNESEQFASCDAKYKVTLHKENNILFIRNAEKMNWLTNNYPVPVEYEFFRYIDWPKLMKDYDGIVITPYLWDMRLLNSSLWYYGWDCASGCLWNPVFDIKEI